MLGPEAFQHEKKIVHLLGTRGVPAQHGGFESCVARLAPFLVTKGWEVYVYCQEDGDAPIRTDKWFGVTRVIIPVIGGGTFSTIKFDWLAINYALRLEGLLLSFGYPTGVFSLLPWYKNRVHIINMDGIEWKRSQFGMFGKVAYYINERFAAEFADHLIADHPSIEDHLSTRVKRQKITMIAYGADELTTNDTGPLDFGLDRKSYALVIARPEPDNSILEIVKAFSAKRRPVDLVVLGKYTPTRKYHKKVLDAASEQVIFPGVVYEPDRVLRLRANALFYIHGHRVGGTNPSLVEALGAGSPIIAHDNEFNKWVAADAAVYFRSESDLSAAVDSLTKDTHLLGSLQKRARTRWEADFKWEKILNAYDALLGRYAS